MFVYLCLAPLIAMTILKQRDEVPQNGVRKQVTVWPLNQSGLKKEIKKTYNSLVRDKWSPMETDLPALARLGSLSVAASVTPDRSSRRYPSAPEARAPFTCQNCERMTGVSVTDVWATYL